MSGEFLVLGSFSIAASFLKFSHVSAQISMLKVTATYVKGFYPQKSTTRVNVCMRACVGIPMYMHVHINGRCKTSELYVLSHILLMHLFEIYK